MFAHVSIILPPFPKEPLDRDLIFDTLRRSDSNIRVVTVTKARVTKLWSGPEGHVRVDVTEISSPQEVTCLGLESSAGEGGGLADEVARSALRSARTVLGIYRESLEVMNYLQALDRWVRDPGQPPGQGLGSARPTGSKLLDGRLASRVTRSKRSPGERK